MTTRSGSGRNGSGIGSVDGFSIALDQGAGDGPGGYDIRSAGVAGSSVDGQVIKARCSTIGDQVVGKYTFRIAGGPEMEVG